MRLALLIFTLLATPVLARDLPPEEPTFEKPEFERPDRPGNPEPPERPRQPRNEEEPPKTPVVIAPPKVDKPGLRCYFDDDGVRKVSFNKLW